MRQYDNPEYDQPDYHTDSDSRVSSVFDTRGPMQCDVTLPHDPHTWSGEYEHKCSGSYGRSVFAPDDQEPPF